MGLMPRPHQTFPLVPTMKLLGIMFKNRHWSNTFHTITAEDVDGWCLNWMVWTTPQYMINMNPTHGQGLSSKDVGINGPKTS